MAEHVNDAPKKDLVTAIATTPWVRTLWQGFIVDALVAIGLGLAVLTQGGDITSPAFWGAVGALVGKSLLVSLASYLTRLKGAQKPLG